MVASSAVIMLNLNQLRLDLNHYLSNRVVNDYKQNLTFRLMESARDNDTGNPNFVNDVRPYLSLSNAGRTTLESIKAGVRVEAHALIDGERVNVYGSPDITDHSHLGFIYNKNFLDGKVWVDGKSVFPPIGKLAQIAGLIDVKKPLYQRTYSVSDKAKKAENIRFVYTIDPENRIKETNENDNRMEISLTIGDLENIVYNAGLIGFDFRP